MQLNYSYLNILKLKIYSLISVTLYCVHVTWWKHFTTLAIRVFSLPFFLDAKSPIFAVGFFEKPPELTKDPKWPTFANYADCQARKPCYRHKDIYWKYLNNFHCVDMILANSKFAITSSRFDTFKVIFCKWLKFCYCVLHGTNVTYLAPQNKFLEDLRYYKFIIFLPTQR